MLKKHRQIIVEEIKWNETPETIIEIVNDLKAAIEHHEKFRNSYFWTPPSSASARRNYETYNSRDYVNKYFTLIQTVNCSCKNVYYTTDFTVKYRTDMGIDTFEINAGDIKKFIVELSPEE